MGEVAVTFKLMPEDRDIDLDRIRDEVSSMIDPHSMEEEPVAFGLKALNVVKVIPEDAGGPDETEESLKSIDGVKDVRVTDQRKLL